MDPSKVFFLIYILSLIYIYECKIWKDVGSTLGFIRSKPEPGLRKEVFTVNSEDELLRWPKNKEAYDPQEAFKEAAKRVRRDDGSAHLPKSNMFHFKDSHFVDQVHWVGPNSSVILMLMRDPNPTEDQPNYFYVSRDYGKTFTNITDKFTINGKHMVINDYYPSPINNQHYIITAKFHKYIFISTDACQTFRSHNVTFTPSKIRFNPTYWRYLLAYDEDHPRNMLYVSTDFGVTWRIKASYVRSYYWGVKGIDSPSAFYVETRLPGRRSVISKQYVYWYLYTLLSDAEDFALVDKYLIASKKNSTTGELDLQISYRRGAFEKAKFPKVSTPATSYLFGDASEDQLFVAVDRNRNATLYISDKTGLVYSESMKRIRYHNNNYNSPLPASASINKSFIDLYRVQGIYGIYIATELTKHAPGKRKSKTLISYNKGGDWNLIPAPSRDANGRDTNCTVKSGCSLHLLRTLGIYGAYTKFQPIISKKSAPGLIIAQGSIGSTLQTIPNVYLSANAGITWREILKGSWFYKFADHGGIIVAIKRYGMVDSLSYSWDVAQTWHTYKFSSIKIRVYGLLTEPGEKTTIFTIFGSYAKMHSWFIVQVDMADVLGKQCTSDQYKNWTVVDQKNKTGVCLLGYRQVFEKRTPKERCFNGRDYDRPISTINCPCTRKDYECDEGFFRWHDWFKYICIDDTVDLFDPFAEPAYCPPGTFYNKTKGYRKISGDRCSGGVEREFEYIPTACRTPEPSSYIWYSTRTSIHRLSLSPPKTDINFRINGLRLVLSLDFDQKKNFLFWGDASSDRIYRLHLNGSGYTEEIKGFKKSSDNHTSHLESIAFDWTSELVYWTDSGMRQIGVVRAYPFAKMPEIKVAKVLISENLDKPRAITLHPTAGYMFWTDWGSSPRIERAFMDGTHRKAIVTTNIARPNGITIDLKTNKIYWTEGKFDKIETASMDGTNRQTLFLYNVRQPYSISVLEGNLYWGDWRQATIEKGSIGGSQRSVIKSYVYGIIEVKAFGPSSQQGTTACSSNPCVYICLNRPGGYSCACPDNLILVTRNGQVHCLCPAGTKIEPDGECKATSRTCSPTEFKCDNNNCIPLSDRCNYDDDCKDGSDERHCVYPTCSPTEFKCPIGKCLPSSYKCDGDNDCKDNADELGCKSHCPPNFFVCKNNLCVHQAWVCDGDNDCHDGSDEVNCKSLTIKPATTSSPCSSGYVACSNGSKCIPRASFCNGRVDCPDASDEPLGCHVPCGIGQSRCWYANRCVNDSLICDGKDDCSDRTDEMGCSTGAQNGTTPQPTTPYTTKSRPAEKCPPGYFKCYSDPTCIPMSARCNQKRDCPDGSDERSCPTSSGKILCDYYPFGFNCSDNEPCISSDKRCDGAKDCIGNSDESKICKKAARVSGFEASTEGNYVRLKWNAVKNPVMVSGYHLIYRSETHKGELDPTIPSFQYNYLLKDVHGCSNYRLALGLKIKGLPKEDWLYSFTSIVTPVIDVSSKPSKLKFVEEVDRNGGILSWEEPKYCLLRTRLVICVHQMKDKLERQTFEVQGSYAELLGIKENTHYNCTVQLKVRHERTGDIEVLHSDWYDFKTTSFGGKMQPQADAKKSIKSTLVWAIPVTLVVLILVVALVIMVTKYRSLQRSFMAFANRRLNQANKEGEEVAVAFRAGEEAPMIKRFPEDEPLV